LKALDLAEDRAEKKEVLRRKAKLVTLTLTLTLIGRKI